MSLLLTAAALALLSPILIIVILLLRIEICRCLLVRKIKNLTNPSLRLPKTNFYKGMYRRFYKRLGPMDTVLANAKNVCFRCFSFLTPY